MRWLTDLWELEKEISNLEMRLKQLKLEMPGHEAIQALEGIIEFKKETRTGTIELVSTFSTLQNKIMKLKYIDGLTLDKVAQQLGYSSNRVKQIHAELIKTIKSNREVG
ncbi:sigma factor-like helix-turn-helix DNA-binding protein [Sporosarcina sp. FSL W7-1283]|uniref:sigma factor-like helix-turn-helix DNA-binding protein n=1 Tax=Sporosarcina sp. FSL W7-1283 TaxID=2921560 RepID=UPI0030FAFEB9